MNTSFDLIKWSDAMATGIPEIDSQHQYLVEMLSEANAKLIDDHDADLLAQIAKDLLGYALLHFETEENLMKRYRFGAERAQEAGAHIAQHRGFSRQVVAICDALREGRHVSHLEVLAFLNNWLRDHVLGVDRSLAAFIRNAAVERDEVGASRR
jgi:hemerythrin